MLGWLRAARAACENSERAQQRQEGGGERSIERAARSVCAVKSLTRSKGVGPPSLGSLNFVVLALPSVRAEKSAERDRRAHE